MTKFAVWGHSDYADTNFENRKRHRVIVEAESAEEAKKKAAPEMMVNAEYLQAQEVPAKKASFGDWWFGA